MLRQHTARPGSIVIFDSIPGSSSSDSDFQLTSLCVVDERGDAFPVAFCVSNRTDQPALEVFLDCIKAALTPAEGGASTPAGGGPEGVVLMADDTPGDLNAWTAVMGGPARQLLTPWYVDRCWRANHALIHGGFDPRMAVYKTLRALLLVDSRER